MMEKRFPGLGFQWRADVLFALGFFLAVSIAAAGGLAFIVRDYAKARASHDWPVVEGIVLSPRSDDDERFSYVYHYGGETHHSRTIGFISNQFGFADVGNLTSGDRVRVHVDPSKPGKAVLQTGGSGWVMAVGAIFSAACLFVGAGGVAYLIVEGPDRLKARNLSKGSDFSSA